MAYTITLTQGPTLARVNADWIVEDPASGGGGHTPFPHFDAVWFEDAYAATANGSRYGMDRGQMYGISGRCAPHAYDSANFWASSVGGEG